MAIQEGPPKVLLRAKLKIYYFILVLLLPPFDAQRGEARKIGSVAGADELMARSYLLVLFLAKVPLHTILINALYDRIRYFYQPVLIIVFISHHHNLPSSFF